MTACSPRRASGQLLVPAQDWALRDALHRGGAARTATPPGVGRLGALSSSPEALDLPGAGLSHLARPRGLQEPRWGAHAPGGWHSRGWVCGEGTGPRANVDKKLSGGDGAGRGLGKPSNHLLKSDRVGGGAPGRRPQPPGVRVELLRAGRETLKSRGWRGGTDREALPPPPGVPAPGSPSLRRARSARTVPAGPGRTAAASSAGRRSRGSARHRRYRPPSRGSGGAGEAAGAGIGAEGRGKGAAPLPGGGCAAPQRAAARPRPPPAASALRRSVSEFAGVSASRCKLGRVQRPRVGWLRSSGSLPPRRGAPRVPLGPGEGGRTRVGGRAGPASRGVPAALSEQGTGRGAGAALGGPRTPLQAGGGALRGAFGGSRLPSLSASRPAPGEAATSFAFQQSISAITSAPISAAQTPGPGRGSLLRWSRVLAAEAPATDPHYPGAGVPCSRLASGSGASALGARPGLRALGAGEGAGGGEWRELGFVHPPSHSHCS